jgi:hypothetical protein
MIAIEWPKRLVLALADTLRYLKLSPSQLQSCLEKLLHEANSIHLQVCILRTIHCYRESRVRLCWIWGIPEQYVEQLLHKCTLGTFRTKTVVAMGMYAYDVILH